LWKNGLENKTNLEPTKGALQEKTKMVRKLLRVKKRRQSRGGQQAKRNMRKKKGAPEAGFYDLKRARTPRVQLIVPKEGVLRVEEERSIYWPGREKSNQPGKSFERNMPRRAKTQAQ